VDECATSAIGPGSRIIDKPYAPVDACYRKTELSEEAA
jgi:hypothetical protein